MNVNKLIVIIIAIVAGINVAANYHTEDRNNNESVNSRASSSRKHHGFEPKTSTTRKSTTDQRDDGYHARAREVESYHDMQSRPAHERSETIGVETVRIDARTNKWLRKSDSLRTTTKISTSTMASTIKFDDNGLPYLTRTMKLIYEHADGTLTDNEIPGKGTEYNVDNTNVTLSCAGADIPQPSAEIRREIAVLAYKRMAETPKVIAFAIAPAQVNRELVDYTTKEGIAIYKQAVKSLYDDGAGFTLEPSKKFIFVGLLKARVTQQGWTELVTVRDATGTDQCLITKYGKLTEADVKASADAIQLANNRVKQEDHLLYQCLHKSLTSSAIQRLELQKKRYSTGADADGPESGIMMLKFIMVMSSVDTRATSSKLWKTINSGMPEIMEEHGNNVTAFNDEIRLVQNELFARGEDPTNIVPQLFEAYEGMHNGEGKMGRYVELISNRYSAGEDFTDVSLMEAIDTKYRELTENDDKTTKTKSKAEDQILALQSQIAKLQTEVNKGGNSSDKPDKDSNTSDERSKARKIRRQVEKRDKPKDGEPTTIVVEGKKFHWCDGGNGAHKPKWVVHDPKDCRGNKDTGTKTQVQTEEKKADTEERKAAGFPAMTGYASDEEDIDHE